MYYITRRWSGHAYQAETNVPHVARNVWPSGNVSISYDLQDLKLLSLTPSINARYIALQ